MKKKSKAKLILDEENTISDFQELFNMWKEVPIVQILDEGDLYKSINIPIQSAILKILRKGIEDKYKAKRHYLTANELLECVNNQLADVQNPIKISMLYYHMERLIDFNLVDFYYYVEGRHKRKYFGRTAKLYLFRDFEKEVKLVVRYFSTISKLIAHFNPEVDLEEIRETLDTLKIEQSEFSNQLIDWMRANHELLYELDIDALDFFTAFTTFIINSDPVKRLFSQLSPYLNFLNV